MSSTDHSTRSQASFEKSRSLLHHIPSRGTQKVKYQEDSEWDHHVDGGNQALDLSLMLPHYRARNQPVDHRMSMLVENDTEPIKLKVCRNLPQCHFCLEVLSEDSDVTLWLPSDFRGQIHTSTKPSFSAGFINRILRNVRLNERDAAEYYDEDHIVVVTRGRIAIRMWDVRTCSPENTHKESLKRMFGCSRKAPETAIDWDFLLKD